MMHARTSYIGHPRSWAGRQDAAPDRTWVGSGSVAVVQEKNAQLMENHGKTMGKPWENHRKMVVFHGILWDLPEMVNSHIGKFFNGKSLTSVPLGQCSYVSHYRSREVDLP